tara:strand:+ start:2287 stop:3267 length:981 start_codon:yes stop_codon:yes gene_type:complete
LSNEKKKRPKKPRVLYRNYVIDYVEQTLQLENPDQEIIRFKRSSRANNRSNNSVLQFRSVINWLPNNLKPDLIRFTHDTVGTITNSSELGHLQDDYTPDSIDTVVIIENEIEMENRRDLPKKRLDNLLSKVAFLQITQARRQILVLTDKGTYFALRKHFKDLLSSQINGQTILPEKTRLSSSVAPQYFTVKDLPGLEVRLVQFPVFINDEIVPKLENTTLTFSQILGGFQYGLLKLDDLPEHGSLAKPTIVKKSNRNEEDEVLKPEVWNWNTKRHYDVNIKEIVTYLFERSGFMKDHKGKSTYRGNSSNSAPGSGSKITSKEKQKA